MCKLILGIKKAGKNEDFINSLKAQFDVMTHEPHGIGAFIKTKEHGVEYMRHLTNYKQVFDWVVENADKAEMVGIHTRTMSTGKVCLRNCHFMENDGYLFAHNGFARKFSGYSVYSSTSATTRKLWDGGSSHWGKNVKIEGTKASEKEYEEAAAKIRKCAGCQISYKQYCKTHKKEAKLIRRYEGSTDVVYDDETNEDAAETGSEDPKIVNEALEKEERNEATAWDKGIDTVEGEVPLTDSELFSKTLKKPFTLAELRKHVVDSDFTGMGVLINGHTADTYLLVQKKCYALKGDGFVVFCSYDPEDTYTEVKFGQICGVLYEEGEEAIDIPVEKLELIEGTYKIDQMAKTA